MKKMTLWIKFGWNSSVKWKKKYPLPAIVMNTRNKAESLSVCFWQANQSYHRYTTDKKPTDTCSFCEENNRNFNRLIPWLCKYGTTFSSDLQILLSSELEVHIPSLSFILAGLTMRYILLYIIYFSLQDAVIYTPACLKLLNLSGSCKHNYYWTPGDRKKNR